MSCRIKIEFYVQHTVLVERSSFYFSRKWKNVQKLYIHSFCGYSDIHMFFWYLKPVLTCAFLSCYIFDLRLSFVVTSVCLIECKIKIFETLLWGWNRKDDSNFEPVITALQIQFVQVYCLVWWVYPWTDVLEAAAGITQLFHISHA